MLLECCIYFYSYLDFNEFNDYYIQGRIQSILGQIGTYIEPTKVPPWLVLSRELFNMCASRYSKNALAGSVCS